MKNGRLEGDLIVYGTGDPTFSDHARKDALAPMREIADSLAARGITSIGGRIVAAGDPFPGPEARRGVELGLSRRGLRRGLGRAVLQ